MRGALSTKAGSRAGVRRRFAGFLLAGGLLLAAYSSLAVPPGSATTVLGCELSGTVDSGTASHLSSCVKKAAEQGHHAAVVRIDTPGGSLEATQQIVQRFLGAEVPVLVWVGPSGARAGSAGTFLVLASHFAGMAEGTRIGAAHPVGLTGRDLGEAGGELAQKVENDAAAFVASIARARGRNAEWAMGAVRESVSVPADEAVRLRVVEVMASSEAELLAAADGKTVSVGDERVTLDTASARIVELEPTPKERILHALASPSLAYLLLMLGGLGLAIEMINPGMVLPGVLGAACMLLAMMALAALPVRAGAVILLLLGVVLIATELFVASGFLGAAGVLLLILGGLFLVDPVDPNWFVDGSFAVPARLVIPSAVLAGVASIFVLTRAAQARRLPARVGGEALVGERGATLSEVNAGGGEVFVHGERWRAVADHRIAPNEQVVVRGFEGLTLHIQEVS